MVDITLTLASATGEVIVIDDENYVIETGLRGFGVPNTVLRIDASAGDGGIFRFKKRDVRELDLPITVLGHDRADVETKLRKLARVFADKVTLTAVYSTGEAYQLDIYYAGGAETQFGEDAGLYHCRWVITAKAPQPYWTATQAVTFSVSGATATKGLLKAESGVNTLSRLQVKSSQALGLVSVENVGDVPAPVTWTLKGPCDDVTILLDGVGFVYDAALLSTDTITIDTNVGTVIDQTGANKYASLGAAPKLFSIPAGVQNLSIAATNATTATRISGYFNPRFEVIH
jgi:phage-related protein